MGFYIMLLRVCFVSFFVTTIVTGQTLPSHGAISASGNRVVRPEPSQRSVSYTGIWNGDFGVDLLYMPSPGENLFEEAIGVGLNATFPLKHSLGLRFGVGHETFSGNKDVEDADVIPFGFSFLMGPPTGTIINMGLELGLLYHLVDYSDDNGDYDDAVGGVAGIILTTSGTSAATVELGAKYRFAISPSENDEDEEISLDGVYISLSLRVAY